MRRVANCYTPFTLVYFTLCVQGRGGAAADGDDAEGLARRRSCRRHVLNRVWSRPARQARLRGPYDSPATSDDDGGVDDDEAGRDGAGQRRLLTADTAAAADLSADDVDQLHADRLLAHWHSHDMFPCLLRRFLVISQVSSLQCFDAVGWVAGRASGL